MGGKTAAVLSLLYPELVESLAMMDIAPLCYRERPQWTVGETIKTLEKLTPLLVLTYTCMQTYICPPPSDTNLHLFNDSIELN
jgi:pimeloyl-ACP methyl ester carboxylesterase